MLLVPLRPIPMVIFHFMDMKFVLLDIQEHVLFSRMGINTILVKLTPEYVTFDWGYEKLKSKFKIKKIQRNPKKNATTVIFENGHVEVVKRNELDPEADLYSVVAYAVAKYVYGSNSAFKRQIRDCIFESLEVK